ncbi:Transposase, Mutator family [Streptomyces sp. AVP053U2]|nr:Transposase, Mutator family [Streptomyces sp. AVP053U2]
MIANRRSNVLSRPDHKIVDRTKIRDGQVANRPVHTAVAVTAEGHRDILGIWAGDGGHFPNEAAAMKCVYMALMSLDPTGKGRKRWTMRWKAPLNAFQIAFEGRLTPANN